VVPDFPGKDLPGILALKSLEDGRKLKGWINSVPVKKAVIVGMGISGVGFAAMVPASLAIVVNAYNRPASLARLLASLSAALVPEGVNLHISIDGSGDPEVKVLAETFEWTRGEKTIHPGCVRLSRRNKQKLLWRD